jgi:saccharopine dehydrogenase-like NADP-dependent oxidoreductase
MKACIFGVGAMGLPAAWAMLKLGFDLQLIEEEDDRFDSIEALLGVRPQDHTYEIDDDCDVVVSCVPYLFNHIVAEECSERGIPYCDLGGNPIESGRIQKDFGNKIGVFTDLGLAPGYLNIMAEYFVAKYPDQKYIYMRCGGLPSEKMDNKLKYARVFHIEGLTNEYSGLCDVIKDGQHKQVEALENESWFQWEHDGRYIDMECFPTKGCTNVSMKSMLDRGIREFTYKTVRYKGHVKWIKFLMKDCKITGKEFSRAIINACPRTKKDIVYTSVDSGGIYRIQKIIEHDDQWTAMQKGTSFPAAAVAAIMANRKEPKVWTYEDVPLDQFQDNLRIICGDELVFD